MDKDRIVLDALPVCLRESSAGLRVWFVSTDDCVEELENGEHCAPRVWLVWGEEAPDGASRGDFEDEVRHARGGEGATIG